LAPSNCGRCSSGIFLPAAEDLHESREPRILSDASAANFTMLDLDQLCRTIREVRVIIWDWD
jgi:hypothetical protein